MVLILEDDTARVARFRAVLAELAPGLELRVWLDAHGFVREAGPLVAAAPFVSLDHDLEPAPGAPDPGDGYQVACWLADRPDCPPVVIHTSNGPRAEWMAGALDLGGKRHVRVAPLGDDWIEVDWRHAARRVLRRRQRSRRPD